MNNLGTNITAARIACMLDQSELAERVQTSGAMICLIEKGQKTPSVALLARIADALDTSTDKLLGREEREKHGQN